MLLTIEDVITGTLKVISDTEEVITATLKAIYPSHHKGHIGHTKLILATEEVITAILKLSQPLQNILTHQCCY